MAITLTREFIDKYEEELDAKYRREKDAIQVMRQMLQQGEAGKPATPTAGAIQAQHAALPPLETTTDAQSLAGKIEEICEEFADEQWTMRRMLKYLQQIGFEMRDKPEGSISAALGKLAQSGKLAVVRRGSGSIPSIYQWSAAQPSPHAPPQDSDTSDEGNETSEEAGAQPGRPELVAREALG